MRFVYIALIAIFASLVLLFKVQNVDSVTVSILSMSLTLPLSVLIFLVYVRGCSPADSCWRWCAPGSAARRHGRSGSHST